MLTSLDFSSKQRKQLTKQLRAGYYKKIIPGYYERTDHWDNLYPTERFALTCIAVGSSRQNSVLTGHAAAVVMNLPILSNYREPVYVVGSSATSPAHGRTRNFRWIGNQQQRVITLRKHGFAVRVTSVADTIGHIARYHGLHSALRTLDHCLKNRKVTYAEMQRVADELAHTKGIENLRRCIALSNSLTESPRETDLRLGLVQHNITGYVAQVEIKIPGFLQWFRVDFCKPELMICLEYDGHAKSLGVSTPDSERRAIEDKKRMYALTNYGFIVIRIDNSTLDSGLWVQHVIEAHARRREPVTQMQPGVFIRGGEKVVYA